MVQPLALNSTRSIASLAHARGRANAVSRTYRAAKALAPANKALRRAPRPGALAAVGVLPGGAEATTLAVGEAPVVGVLPGGVAATTTAVDERAGAAAFA